MGSRKVSNPNSRRTHNAPGASGLPVDAGGNPTIDPTENVISLVEAANRRTDDLRDASNKLNEVQYSHLKEIVTLESTHIKEIVTLRAGYDEKLAKAESERINAIRAVDVGAVAITSERSAQQAAVLANQVSASAETQRNLVNQTAQNIAEQQRQSNEQFNARISAVERAQYEGQGKGSIQDPQMAALIEQMTKLTQANNKSEGRGGGMKDFIGWIIAAIAIAFTILNYIKQ